MKIRKSFEFLKAHKLSQPVVIMHAFCVVQLPPDQGAWELGP